MASFSGHMPTFDDMLKFAAGCFPATPCVRPAGAAKPQEEMSKAVIYRELSRKPPVYLGIGRLLRWKLGRASLHVE